MELTNKQPVQSFRRLRQRASVPNVSYDRGSLSNVIQAFQKNRLALGCLLLLLLILIAALCAPLSPYDPDAMDLYSRYQGPSLQHLFGTDDMGRDYFTRSLYGGRVSLAVGFASMLCSTVLGVLIGSVSGFVGGKLDTILMRGLDVFMSVPSLLLIIIINAFITPSISTLVLIISSFSWMDVARIVRAHTLSLKERDFILAAQGLGTRSVKIIWRHILPNVSSPVIVAASLSIAKAILTESSLSFLGFGVRPPTASWGSMLQEAQKVMTDLPHLAVFSGLLILLTVLCFHIIGDVLRDALEPRMVR